MYKVIQMAIDNDDMMHELLMNSRVNSDLPITKLNGKLLNCLQALQVTAFTNEHRKLLTKCTELKKKLREVLKEEIRITKLIAEGERLRRIHSEQETLLRDLEAAKADILKQ
jgi:predicted RecB family endonuclease